MALEEWERTTDIETSQFFEFLEFVISEGHTQDVVAHLKSNGFDKIRCSVQPIRAIQELLKQKYTSPTAKSAVIITSAHIDGICKSK